MVDNSYPQDVSFLIITATGLVGILVLFFLVFIFYYQKKLFQQQHAKQLMETQLQEQMLLGSIQGQERERARLGQEIHDGLGAQLASIKLMLENSRSMEDMMLRNQADERAIELLHDSLQELRRTSQNLLPQPLTRFGFVKGIENYFKQLTRTSGITASFHTNTSQLALTSFQSLSLYRVIQELTRNALEHGKARHFSLSLHLDCNILKIILEEDGQLYDWNNLKENFLSSSGSGITNIETRLRLLSANLTHEPLSKGNRVCITLPLDFTNDDTHR